MKKIITSIFFTITAICSAQFNLERTYDDGDVTRIKLEYSGEKYYLFNKATNELKLFNADHSVWKLIVLPIPPTTGVTNVHISDISEAKFNIDSNVEITFSYSNYLANINESKIVSENGDILLDLANANDIHISEISGLPLKLLVSFVGISSKVYSISDLTLEHTYPEGNINRMLLDGAGEKYALVDFGNSQIKIFNQDHTLWKTIDAPKPANGSYTYIINVFENPTDAGGPIEVGYSYYYFNGTNYVFEGKLINENNETKLVVPDAISFYINKIEGADDKLMVSRQLQGLESHTNYYNWPSLVLDHAYATSTARTKLEFSGEKYFETFNPSGGAVKLFNPDHSLWKTIALPLPDPACIVTSISVSEAEFNGDPLLELIYSYDTSPLGFTVYGSRIINELGLNYLTVPGARYLTLSKIDGLDHKLIASLNVGADNNYGQVYSTPLLATENFTSFDTALLSPNPAASVVAIQSRDNIREVSVYNSVGMLVEQLKSTAITQINVEKLANGIYFLKFINGSNKAFTCKLSIKH